MNIGQVCIKIAGREAGNTAVVIDVVDDNYVMIDGNVRRKKCNIRHLEPLELTAKIAKNASTKEVMDALRDMKLPVRKESKFTSKKEAKTSLQAISSKQIKQADKPENTIKQQKAKKPKNKEKGGS